MKQTNLIEENQKLKNDKEYLERKFKEVKKDNLELRKENEFLKKNLDSMKTKTPPLLLFLSI